MTGSNNKHFYLAGDIGGTKTNLGLFKKGIRRPILESMETYRSSRVPSLEVIIEQFLISHPAPVDSACFGIPGPESMANRLVLHACTLCLILPGRS